jgi:hypothetical protein
MCLSVNSHSLRHVDREAGIGVHGIQPTGGTGLAADLHIACAGCRQFRAAEIEIRIGSRPKTDQKPRCPITANPHLEHPCTATAHRTAVTFRRAAACHLTHQTEIVVCSAVVDVAAQREYQGGVLIQDREIAITATRRVFGVGRGRGRAHATDGIAAGAFGRTRDTILAPHIANAVAARQGHWGGWQAWIRKQTTC